MLAIYTLDITSLFGPIWFAFAGALAVSVLVFALGSLGGGGATPVTLALAGAAVSVLLFALVQGLILLGPAESRRLPVLRRRRGSA